MVSITLRCNLAGPLCCIRSHPAAAQEPFYKGKRITILINFAAGGPTDIEGDVRPSISPSTSRGSPYPGAEYGWRGRRRGRELSRRGCPKDGTPWVSQRHVMDLM